MSGVEVSKASLIIPALGASSDASQRILRWPIGLVQRLKLADVAVPVIAATPFRARGSGIHGCPSHRPAALATAADAARVKSNLVF
jgi:hypothetical protein